MSLSPGTRLGPYEVTAQIGVGGMGEVYRATDTNLKRSVAIKVLPTSVAGDVDRLARFQREAEVLAALNHPNIAQIYGLEKSESTIALVMELVEGPTLADIIAGVERTLPGSRGEPHQAHPTGLPVDEALPIAKQIAEALEAAHEQGIIHRDLKPANIKVRPDGTVKVLDFGLAKALGPPEGGPYVRRSDERGDGVRRGDLQVALPASQAPTITSPALMTGAGMILGTAAYMSPEQAKGRVVDRGADLWAFGCVLYEMLTGVRLFAGEDPGEVLADVIKGDVGLAALPADTSLSVRRLLRRCLTKDRKDRLADAGVARLELMDATLPAEASSGAYRRASAILAGVGVLTLTVGTAMMLWRSEPAGVVAQEKASRFFLVPPTGLEIQMRVVSPDGTRLAMASGSSNSANRVWIQHFDSGASELVRGTEGIISRPFWSPDSRSIGFVADGKVQAIDVVDGSRRTIAEFPEANPYWVSGSWHEDGTIVFSGGLGAGLYRVSATGGVAEPLTRPTAGEAQHLWPEFLPNGYVLYLSRSTTANQDALYAVPKSGGSPVRLTALDSNVAYVAGYLVYARGATLVAHPFNVDEMRLFGEPQPIVNDVQRIRPFNQPEFSVSRTGILIYEPESENGMTRFEWTDRNGALMGTVGEPGRYGNFDLSPDEALVAVDRRDEPNQGSIWVIDTRRGVTTRLTRGPYYDTCPIWSPDGTFIAFDSNRAGANAGVFRIPSAGGSETAVFAMSRTPSLHLDDWWGDTITFNDDPSIYRVDAEDREPPTVVVSTNNANIDHSHFSPDGRWLAYNTDESGRWEVYVSRYPTTGERWQVSVAGGGQPRWRGDGRELYYLTLDGKLMSVPVATGSAFVAQAPRVMFDTQLTVTARGDQYIPSSDGRRFLIKRPVDDTSEERTALVLNWPALLE